MCLMYILVGAPAEFESLSLNWCLASISYPGKASPTLSPHPFELHWLFWTEAILTFYLVQWTRLLFKNSGWGVAVLTALMPPPRPPSPGVPQAVWGQILRTIKRALHWLFGVCLAQKLQARRGSHADMLQPIQERRILGWKTLSQTVSSWTQHVCLHSE